MTKYLNSNLHSAKNAKNDEFYTQLTDIEKELKHYKQQFKGKTVLCNCDDPSISNFFYYFAYNFHYLGLKKLITTCYKSQERDLFSKHDKEQAIFLEYDGFRDNENIPNIEDIGVKYFQGDGDFRNAENINLLKQADIVVTNPPFSLFREYVQQLVEYDKKFLIIGDQNAITYKEIFKLIKYNLLWLGYDNGGTKWFQVPMDYDIKTKARIKIEDSIKYFSKGSISWYTNMETTKRYEDLILYKTYTPEEYPTYDNYNAINVDKVKDIPMDYAGIIGVPITFIDKYNPKQFEILGKTNNKEHAGKHLTNNTATATIKGVNMYHRILIKNKRL